MLAQQKVRENKSAFLPTFSGNASFDYNIKLQTSIIPAGTFGSTETKLQIGNKFSTGAYLEADQAILDKSSSLSIRSAKVDKKISDLSVFKENESLIYNTASAYYQVLTYGEKGKLLRENENQYKQFLSILKLLYEQGVVKKSEYDGIHVSLNNIRAELSLNENNYQFAVNKLKNAMGIDLSTLININDSIDYSAQVAMRGFRQLGHAMHRSGSMYLFFQPQPERCSFGDGNPRRYPVTNIIGGALGYFSAHTTQKKPSSYPDHSTSSRISLKLMYVVYKNSAYTVLTGYVSDRHTARMGGAYCKRSGYGKNQASIVSI